MTLDELKALFEKHEDEFIKFERVKGRRSKRSDLHAFLLLDELVPGKRDMVCAAEHDEVWLDVKPRDLANIADEEHVIELIRCGVRYDASLDSFAMFV